MDRLTWSIQTSQQDAIPRIVSEYLLNELGIFVKRERRMPKSKPLTALTGFRVGYVSVTNTDYCAQPVDRNALLWHKITEVSEVAEFALTVNGNRSDTIEVFYPAELRDAVFNYITTMRQLHPAVADADPVAASWLCWRDDDDWDDPILPLINMVETEQRNKRFIEPEILYETTLTPDNNYNKDIKSVPVRNRPKFCVNCGATLSNDGNFCVNCGIQVMS